MQMKIWKCFIFLLLLCKSFSYLHHTPINLKRKVSMTSREAHSHCISKICSVPKYFPQFSTKPLTLPLVLSKNFKNPLYLVPSFLVAAPMIRHRRGIFQAARSLLRGVSVTASTLSFLAKYVRLCPFHINNILSCFSKYLSSLPFLFPILL